MWISLFDYSRYLSSSLNECHCLFWRFCSESSSLSLHCWASACVEIRKHSSCISHEMLILTLWLTEVLKHLAAWSPLLKKSSVTLLQLAFLSKGHPTFPWKNLKQLQLSLHNSKIPIHLCYSALFNRWSSTVSVARDTDCSSMTSALKGWRLMLQWLRKCLRRTASSWRRSRQLPPDRSLGQRWRCTAWATMWTSREAPLSLALASLADSLWLL